MFKKSLIAAFAVTLCLVFLGTGKAQAAPVIFYQGPHPVAKASGGGFCYKNGLHYHLYKPSDVKQFSVRGDIYYFTSDPVLYGYKKKMQRYFGHHPVSNSWGGGICYIAGPHYHYYKPSTTYASRNYKVRKGYYYYTGAWDGTYRKSYNVYLHKDPRWRYVSHPLYGKKYVPVRSRTYYRRSVRTAPGTRVTTVRPGSVTTTVVRPGTPARPVRPVRRVVH